MTIYICIQWIFIEEFTKHGTNRLIFFSYFVFCILLLFVVAAADDDFVFGTNLCTEKYESE